MHFVLSWDISATGEQRAEIEKRLKAVIKDYSWVKPLTTFYILQVAGQQEWNSILHELTEAAVSKPVAFIMSPLMSGGIYNGLLPGNLWNEINQRTGA